MRLLSLALFFLAGCASIGPSPAARDWVGLEREVVGIVSGESGCGPASYEIGFCRKDGRESPTLEQAALSDACRGQPVTYLAAYGQSPADIRDRKAVAAALAALFAAPPFGGDLRGLDDRALLKAVHDRDQAMRFFRPAIQVGNPDVLENSKWVAICAHALFARNIVERFLKGTTPEALANDEELANHAWLLVQHSDFDPNYQLRMSQWFGRSDAPHMKGHSAYLYDRAMVGLHRPQRFGTQLRCNEGVREPFPVEDLAGMDSRRVALGLKPMREHLATFPRPCPPPKPKA